MCDDVWIYKISILEWVYKQTYSWGGPRCRKASIAAISCYFSGPCQKWFHTVDISTINPTWAYNIFFWVPKKGKVIIHCSFCFMDLLMSEPFFSTACQTSNIKLSNEFKRVVVHCQRRSLESNSMADRVLYFYGAKRANSSPKTGVPGTELNRMPENPIVYHQFPTIWYSPQTKNR